MPSDAPAPFAEVSTAQADSQDMREVARAAVFSRLGSEDWDALLACGEFIDVCSGSLIVEEGGPSAHLQVICTGEAEVRKREPVTRREQVVSVLGPGETFGELGVARSGAAGPLPAIASIVARTPMRLFRAPTEVLRSSPKLSGVRQSVVENVAHILTGRIEKTNELVVDALRRSLMQQRLLGQYLVNLIFIFSLFSLSMFALTGVLSIAESVGISRAGFGTLHSVLFTFLLSGGLLYSLRHAMVDFRALGVDLANWRSDLVYALLWSAPLIIAMAPTRAFVYPDESVLAPYVWLRERPDSVFYELGLFVFYVAVIAWLQEFIARVALQAVIFDMLAEKRRMATVLSIGVSAIGFGSFHAFYGLDAVAATILIGLYWGVMFHCRRSLLAVGISHMLIGAAGCYMFGLVRW